MDIIKDMFVITKHSAKKNTDYSVLAIRFESGYKIDKLINNEERFCLVNSGVRDGDAD